MKKLLIAVVVVVVITIIIVTSLKGGSTKKGKEVYLEEVERNDIVSIVSASGEIQPKKKVNISSEVIGKIEVLNVDEGDHVEKGQTLLRLDPDIYQSDVDSLEASVRMAGIDIENRKLSLVRAEKTLSRNRDLFKKGLISQDLLDDLELNYESAKIAVLVSEETVIQSKAALRRARESLDNTTIISPISGIITYLNAEEGETVMTGTMNNAGTVIMIVSDMEEVIAELEVDESDVVKLELGQSTVVDVDAIEDHEYVGKVSEIGSSARMGSDGVPVFDVEISLESPDGKLFPGMSTDGKVETGNSMDVITVPIQCVLKKERKDDEDETASAVFIFEDDSAKLVFVETGLSDETHIEVTSGLEEGTKIVTGPYRILRDLEEGDSISEKEIKNKKKKKDKDMKDEESEEETEDEDGIEVRVN